MQREIEEKEKNMNCELFDGIEGEELEKMLKCLSARRVKMERGQTLFAEGEAAGQVGVVLSGAVQIRQTDLFGNQTILAHLTKGGIFGEAFACAGVARYPVDAVCQSAGEALLLERVPSPCAQPCPAHSRLIGNMITVLAEKNVRLMDKNRILSRRSTREKLLAYLDIQARAASSREFELPFSRQELADYLCVERSAMTVELMKLDREGLIRVRGRRITLGRRESDA